MTAKKNDAWIESSSSDIEGSDMIKLTLEKLSIVKCNFLIKELHSESAVHLMPNKAFINFVVS